MFDFTHKNNMVLLAVTYIIIALFFFIWPQILKRINILSKIWISTRKLTKPLDMMRDVDEQIFKISRVIGALSLILALIFIYLYRKY